MSIFRKNTFTIATFIIFGSLFFHLAKNMLQIKQDGWYTGQINLYGDLVFHTGFINKFLLTNKIITSSPFYLDSKPNYPIFADFITAQIARYTNINFALFITTFLMGIIVIFIARIFIRKIIKNEKVVFLSLTLFFINGGFGFYYFFKDFLNSNQSLFQFIQNLPREYTDIKENGIWWINTYLAYFLPQRAFLFAFPTILTILILIFIGIKKHKRRYFIAAALISGLLPIIQAHSLLVLFVLVAFYSLGTLFFLNNKKYLFINWIIFGFITTIISFPLFNLISSNQNLLEFIKYDPGWTSEENIILFWLKNLGLFGPTLLIAIFWLYKKNQNLFLLYLPFLALFIISNIFIFQPWSFDNSKILIYWFFASCIVVSFFLYHQFFTKSLPWKTTGIVLVIIMTLSGALDLLRTFTSVSRYQIFTNQDLEIARKVDNLTRPNSIFVTAPNHNHPIPALTGNTTVVGYPGWMWSHGLPFERRSQEVTEIFSGGENAEATIKKYKIDYVTIGLLERNAYIINEEYFKKFPKIEINKEWSIYDVSDLWANSNR